MTTCTEQGSHGSAFQTLKEAAQLRLTLEHWREDREFEKAGGRIVYAVDNDVVNLFVKPREKAKYAHVFGDTSDDDAKVLAWVLAQFIFYRLSGRAPLLLIPPHSREVDNFLRDLCCEVTAVTAEAKGQIGVLERLHDRYGADRNIEALVQGIKEEAWALVQLLDNADIGSGPLCEYRRLTRLLRDLRILHYERYVEKPAAWVLPVLYDDIKREDSETLRELTNKWKPELAKYKAKETKEDSFDHDTQVLARLEWTNRQIGPGRRLILISGDRALYQAACGYVFVRGVRFADLFVRDPRVFLAAPDLLSANAKGAGAESDLLRLGLIEWLDILFARFKPREPDYLTNLHHGVIDLNPKARAGLAETFSRDRADWVDRLRREWGEFVRLAALDADLVPDHDLATRLAQEIAGVDEQDLRKTLERRSWQARLKVGLMVVDAGFWSTAAEEAKTRNLPARGVPALRFPYFPKAKQYADYLVRTLKRERSTGGHPALSELREEDPSGYTVFLVHALGFAVAGRWSTTALLAGLALEIADRQTGQSDQNPDKSPRGVAAAYLLAIALRHGSRKVADLAQVRHYLKDARDHCAGKPDLRLDVEEVALDLTYQHYRVFLRKSLPPEIPSLEGCQERLLQLANRLQTEDEPDETIRLALEKQVLTNIFSVMLLRRYQEGVPNPQLGTHVDQLLIRFHKVMDDQGQPRLRSITCLTQAVYLAACHEFGDTTEQTRNREKVAMFLGKAHDPSCQVLPYDQARFTFLAEHMGADGVRHIKT